MRRSLQRASVAACVALVMVVGAGGAVSADTDDSHHHARRDVAKVREATEEFRWLSVAMAEGYAELADTAGLTCIEDPGGAGAMGTHYANVDLVTDGEIDARHPEVLLYDVSKPRPRLLGVEYVVFVADWGAESDPPELFGHEFHLVEDPNRYGLPAFYELHAWIWKHNPSGMFEDWNPRIAC